MSRATRAIAVLVVVAGAFALGRYTAGGRWTSRASGDSIREALQVSDPYARAARLATLLPTLGAEAVPDARQVLETPEFDLGATELELLVRFWASHDAEGASLWSFSFAPSGYNIAAIQPAVERWATVDPPAAAAHLKTLAMIRGANTDAAELALVKGWFQSGAPGLEDYIKDLGLSFERQRALATLAREMIKRDGSESVRRWAQAFPDQDERFKLDAFRQVGAELAKADPAAAVAWCEAVCEGPYGSNVRSQIATHWAARDGLAAMRWLAAAPEGKERDAAVRSAFSAWRRQDAKGLSDWVEAMGLEGVEPWFRPAVGLHAMTLVRKEPTRALQWAALIEDDQKRELALISIARRWRNQDEGAAEAWLSQSPLSEDARQKARTEAPMKVPPRQRAQPDPGAPS